MLMASTDLPNNHVSLSVFVLFLFQAMQAQLDGADYVGTGAVYPTNTKVV